MYNFNHLYYFYITAKSGGVNNAAKHLRISQPSLSSQLKVLESAFGIPLFRKVGRNNVLTTAGSTIYGYCRQMFEISEEMNELLTEQVPSASRRIQIGVSDQVDRPFVIEVVSMFLKKHGLAQRPKVTVISGTHEQLADRLRFREIDAVVTQSAMIIPELENLVQAEVPVGLICSAKWKGNFPQAKTNINTTLRVLSRNHEAQWLMPSSRLKFRSETDQFFSVNQIKGRVVLESDIIASLVRSVIDEIGFVFLPLLYVAREVRERSVRVIGPKGGYWKYRVWLSCHQQNKNDALIRSLSSSFNEVCKKALH